MANLKQAFEYASQNPESSFAKNLESLASSGSLDAEAKKYGIDLTPFKPVQEKGVVEKAKDVAVGFGKGAIETGQMFAKPITAMLPEMKNVVTGEPIQKGFSEQELQAQNPEQKLGKQLEFGAEILAGGGAGLVKDAVVGGAKVAKTGLEALSKLPKGLGEKALNFVSADPEKKVATILKESTPQELENYVSLAEKASIDPRVATPFEVVGNKLSDATKILETRLGEIGKAKSDIIQPLREGLGAFKKETTPLLNKLNSLKNSFGEIEKGQRNVVGSIIKDAKTVSTKLDADKFIDKVQNALYTGNRDMTIVQGSALDKQLRGIIGEYNGVLKKSLPKEYGNLNKQYSDMIDTLNVINRSLGEVVEGVPTRGASLIKQFFSPSGTKTKEIFEFIKKETGGQVDLAKDSTLAKFTMELFDDPRARSLLQGVGDIPTTLGGVATKVIEKVGGEKLQTAMRKSTISKAKGISSPK